jgi:hypothetical protein
LLGALAVERAGHGTDVLVGVIPVENLHAIDEPRLGEIPERATGAPPERGAERRGA